MAATPDCPSVWFSKVMVWISPHCQFAGSLPWVWVRASTAAANWQWGDVHTITFENQTLGQSGVSAVEWLFNRGPYPVSGSTSVVNATSWGTQDLAPARTGDYAAGDDATGGDSGEPGGASGGSNADPDGEPGPAAAPVVALPSQRMAVDLSDLSASRSGHTTGQSGHAFHEHYGDMIDLWLGVRYHPMLWAVCYAHLRAHETKASVVWRIL